MYHELYLLVSVCYCASSCWQKISNSTQEEEEPKYKDIIKTSECATRHNCFRHQDMCSIVWLLHAIVLVTEELDEWEWWPNLELAFNFAVVVFVVFVEQSYNLSHLCFFFCFGNTSHFWPHQALALGGGWWMISI